MEVGWEKHLKVVCYKASNEIGEIVTRYSKESQNQLPVSQPGVASGGPRLTVALGIVN